MVRSPGPEDEALVRRVLHRFKGHETLEPDEFLRDPRTLLLIAEAADEVAGWLYAYELIRPDGGRSLLLYEVEVGVAARGRGHGRALIEALLAEARARGHFEVWVLADSHNAAAAALYATTGAEESPQRMFTWDLR